MNFGGKTIFVATCVSLITMFMTWADAGIISQSGFSQLAFLFLVFWVYPITVLAKNRVMSRTLGVISAVASIGLTIAYIYSKNVDVLDHTVNPAGSGAWLFFFASFALLVGVLKYKPRSRII